jgi:L-ascorbate oxidase
MPDVAKRKCGYRSLAAACVGAALICSPQSVRADALLEPAVFASANGVLDILMIAKPKPVPTIVFTPPNGGAPMNPIGWVYEVCRRPVSGNQCPADATTVSDYGGVRLALKPGDVLKVRLVNRLPALDAAKVKHATEPGLANLPRNPTNLHTHGLVVPARAPTLTDPAFGDYVFVEIFNPANGTPIPQASHQHGLIKMDFADYRIDLPKDHPSGLFWFHPHVHGISLNQLSSGLSGIITIGDVKDYVAEPIPNVRHLMLKDMQVLAAGTLQYDSGPVTVTDGEVQHQQIADFCEQRGTGGPNSRRGFCEGEPDEHGTGNSFIHSRWYFTINGQVFPTVRIDSPAGEIWRLTNASGQFSYQLNLLDDSTDKSIPVQLIAIDGVSIDVAPGTPAGTIMKAAGNKFTVVDCPAAAPTSAAVCIKDLIMMPSSRAELWVTYRNADGAVITPPAGATATLVQGLINLGPAGEAWPMFKLAKIEFTNPGTNTIALNVAGKAAAAMLPAGAGSTLAHAATKAAKAPLDVACKSLANGHRRRIFFGMEDPTKNDSKFGLGYEEVDNNGQVVAGTQVPVSAFDPTRTTVCLPLGPNGSAVHEVWELVNLATEIHNFHIHQAKFKVLQAAALSGPIAPSVPVVVEDNVPLPFATTGNADIEEKQNGYCTIEQWKAGTCASPAIVIDIPFSQPGDFAFHCHILEHEDGGMMARIRVNPN